MGEDVKLGKLKFNTASNIAILLLIAVLAIVHLKSILQPLVVAILLFFLIRPPAEWLEKKLGRHPFLAYGALVGIIMAFLFVASNILFSNLQSFTEEVPSLSEKLQNKLLWFEDNATIFEILTCAFLKYAENFKDNTKFDVVLNMEIVEHVEDVNFFLMTCSKLLKKNGIMFVATINKTLKSYLFAIIGAEYILRWLPIGTHEWEKFIKPEDLVTILSKHNLKLDSLDGMKFNLIKDQWNLSSDKSINYIGKFINN